MIMLAVATPQMMPTGGPATAVMAGTRPPAAHDAPSLNDSHCSASSRAFLATCSGSRDIQISGPTKSETAHRALTSSNLTEETMPNAPDDSSFASRAAQAEAQLMHPGAAPAT